MRKNLWILLLLLGFAACTRDDGSRAPADPGKDLAAQEAGGNGGGGVDSGGGTTNTSTAMEVEEAIRIAFELATVTDWSRNVFVRFWLDEARLPGKFPDSGHTLFPKLKLPEAYPSGQKAIEAGKKRDAYLKNLVEKESASFESAVLIAIGSRPPKLLETGDCLSGEHADASVSSFDTSATICMSIGNLRKVAPTVLLQEVLSLLLHEATHMGGAKEEEADIWQSRFSEYFNRRFNRHNGRGFTDLTANSLTEIQLLAENAYELQKLHPGDPKIDRWMGQLEQHLISLPFRFDPLALILASHPFPIHKGQVNNYVNAVIALTQKMNRVFDFSSRERAQASGDFWDLEPSKPRDPKAMRNSLREISELAKVVADNWFVFNMIEDFPSTCVLPEDPVREEDLFIGFEEFDFWMMKPLLPPRVCDPPLLKSSTR